MVNQQWSKDLLKMMRNLNSFIFGENSSIKSSLPLYISDSQVGILTSVVANILKKYPNVFELRKSNSTCSQEHIKLSDQYKTYDERTAAVEEVVRDMAKQNAHVSLKGWRNEYYEVASGPTQQPLMKLERAAVTVFGVKAYGSHMNGYVNHPDKGFCMWIARRSQSKATFPGMLDNMVAGGISSGIGILETMVKECQEEAGIPESLAKEVVPVGMISYVYEDERGIQPDVHYCFDLEVPVDFVPTPTDGEVEEFKLCTINEVKALIVKKDFKPNCAAITLDFLFRKGFVLPDEVPDYIELIQLLHYKFD